LLKLRGCLRGRSEQSARKNSGRPRTGKRKNEPRDAKKKNVYDIIKSNKTNGVGPKTILNHLKCDKEFVQLVDEAGLSLDLKLIRAALRVLPDHETQSRNIS
jgi:hypothetical protein